MSTATGHKERFMPNVVEEVVAPYGEKTIQISIRLRTDHIANHEDHICPKHAWDAGFVTIVTNDAHGISGCRTLPFNSLTEILAKIEELLASQGITLHPHPRGPGRYPHQEPYTVTWWSNMSDETTAVS